MSKEAAERLDMVKFAGKVCGYDEAYMKQLRLAELALDDIFEAPSHKEKVDALISIICRARVDARAEYLSEIEEKVEGLKVVKSNTDNSVGYNQAIDDVLKIMRG